jgi:diaminohydroxyphosphoribosylaminopyrimidine deaminase/5-amino-6-(5-phosphoribosylamino)uracil reductase
LNQPSDAETILVTGPDVAEDARRNVEKKGARVLTVASRGKKVDLTALMKMLGAEGIASILVEGGSRVCGSALRAGIVDKLYFFYAPKLLAGDDGIPICQGPGRNRMQDCLTVNHISVHRFGQDVMVEGYPDNARDAR